MKTCLDLCRTIAMCAVLSGAAIQAPAAAPLGLPPVPIPAAQPKLPPKIALGDRLFHDERFSSDGKVSCLTCHEEDKAFTDHRRVPCSHEGLLGTRRAPAVRPTWKLCSDAGGATIPLAWQSPGYLLCMNKPSIDSELPSDVAFVSALPATLTYAT